MRLPYTGGPTRSTRCWRGRCALQVPSGALSRFDRVVSDKHDPADLIVMLPTLSNLPCSQLTVVAQSHPMKVLKSELAKQVLADPKATEQLRRFLTARDHNGVIIEVRSRGGTFKLKPAVVPKAA